MLMGKEARDTKKLLKSTNWGERGRGLATDKAVCQQLLQRVFPLWLCDKVLRSDRWVSTLIIVPLSSPTIANYSISQIRRRDWEVKKLIRPQLNNLIKARKEVLQGRRRTGKAEPCMKELPEEGDLFSS